MTEPLATDFARAAAGGSPPAGNVLDVGALGVDVAAARARVARYSQARAVLRGRLALVLGPSELARLDSHLWRLPARAAVALLAAVVDADAAGLERLRAQLAQAPPGPWGAAVHLVDAARRAVQPRHEVAVPARLAGDVFADLMRGTAHRASENGSPGASPELRELLAALHDAAGRHLRGEFAPAGFRSETGRSGPATIGKEHNTEGTPTEWVSASDYARKARITRQAATRQAREGRAQARMVGGRWLILTDLEPNDHQPPPDPD